MANKYQPPLRKYALIAGFGLTMMTVIAIFANFMVMERLIVPGDVALTAINLSNQSRLFSFGVFAFGVVIILDFLVAWALYVYFTPAHQQLSSIAAGLRISYGITFAVALFSLIQTLVLLENTGTQQISVELAHQITELTQRFTTIWDFAFVFFGCHLILLGFLVAKSEHINNILALLLIVSGLGYVIDGFAKVLVPSYTFEIAMYTFVGELVFMLWLLFSKHRPQEH